MSTTEEKKRTWEWPALPEGYPELTREQHAKLVRTLKDRLKSMAAAQQDYKKDRNQRFRDSLDASSAQYFIAAGKMEITFHHVVYGALRGKPHLTPEALEALKEKDYSIRTFDEAEFANALIAAVKD
jgi:hypothetical protein